jgi:hypothetical protein
MGKVKFTVFSDLHHHPAWYKTEAPERLAAIQERARSSGSEFLLHLGDLCHQPSISGDLVRQYYKDSGMPAYLVLGNHEFDIDYAETVLAAYGLDCGYYFFDHGGFRFVVLDENYFRDFPGVYFHYSARNYFDHPYSRDWMPPEEIDWLRETVLTSPHPCILASHAVLESPLHSGVRCKDEVKEIILQSQTTPGRVILCLNGHYHRSGLDMVDGVPRLDVNSASFNWIPNPHHLFPEEWYHQYECVGNMIIYTKPVSAVITIDDDARTIDVEGCQGEFVGGVTIEMSGNSSGYRPCTPDMISTHIAY